jgi:hypothetical protein|tara:strand:- start:950 stop:1228 length:279 start_codon:yes stop_codon:yes gene_type:complete
METKIQEHIELIAVREAPGDRWVLTNDDLNKIHPTLTDALEAYLSKTGFKGSYRLDPMNSTLYAIQSNEVEVKKEEPKKYDLYGELNWKQGA